MPDVWLAGARQEVKAPELQRLELLGKTALAIIKYLPLGAPHAAQVRECFAARSLDP